MRPSFFIYSPVGWPITCTDCHVFHNNCITLTPFVWRLDNAIQQMNHYLVDRDVFLWTLVFWVMIIWVISPSSCLTAQIWSNIASKYNRKYRCLKETVHNFSNEYLLWMIIWIDMSLNSKNHWLKEKIKDTKAHINKPYSLV